MQRAESSYGCPRLNLCRADLWVSQKICWMVALLEGACLLRAVEFEASWGRGPGAEGHWTRNAVNYFSGSRWVSSIEFLAL